MDSYVFSKYDDLELQYEETMKWEVSAFSEIILEVPEPPFKLLENKIKRQIELYQRKKKEDSSASSIAPRNGKNVRRSCQHCKKAHLACDSKRPCRRCASLGKVDCQDVKHKKRGRPKKVHNLQ